MTSSGASPLTGTISLNSIITVTLETGPPTLHDHVYFLVESRLGIILLMFMVLVLVIEGILHELDKLEPVLGSQTTPRSEECLLGLAQGDMVVCGVPTRHRGDK